MPLSAREIQHIKTDRQALINSGVEPEHVYQDQEVLLESIFEVTRKIEDSLPIYE